jgi:hypothetical protein
MASCHKNDSPIGITLLPQSDLIGASYAEFIPDIAYTTYRHNDYTVLSTHLSNSSLLGSLNDPIFGRTDASIYCSFETIFTPGVLGEITFPAPPTLDSAVLVLSYNYQPGTSTIFVGDTMDPLTLDIYPLQYNLSPDTNYYSTGNNYYFTGGNGSYIKEPLPYNANKSLIYGGHGINFTPHVNWYAPLKKDTNVYGLPQLRVRLSDEFGEGIFPSCINDNTKFQQYFKGMFITTKNSILPQPSYGSIFFVYLTGGNSHIDFYYHFADPRYPGNQQPAQFNCDGGTCNRFSYFKHDFTIASSDLQNQLSAQYDTTRVNAANNLYVQGCAGVGTVLKFPNLLSWIKNKPYNITINKAELVIKTDRSNTNFYNLTTYPLPGRLYLEGDTLGGPRGLIEDPYNFGGYYDLTNNEYLIEIPNTVSMLVNGKTTGTKFYLSEYNSALFQERLVIGGNSTTTPYPVKLRLWYTNLTTKK